MSKEAVAAAWKAYLDHAADQTEQIFWLLVNQDMPSGERSAQIADIREKLRATSASHIKRIIPLVEYSGPSQDVAASYKRLLADLEALLRRIDGQNAGESSLPLPQVLELISLRIDSLPEGGAG